MISVCFLFFKIPLPRGGPCPSLVVPTGTEQSSESTGEVATHDEHRQA